ncbi:MAG: hypothetical protein H0W83_14050, partial [Planctomycetes bacterium]|nr:hypothetical protein [Planctomycetota bacterium]
VAAVGLLIGGGFALTWMRTDHSAELAASLFADAQTHADKFAPAGASASPAYLLSLVRHFHPAVLADAKRERGSFAQYKPGYDEARYRDSMRIAIGKQIKEPDAVLLNECARTLVTADKATLADVAAAKVLAQQAVTIDGEKNYRSLITLGWTYFKSGDTKRARLIGEQAMEIAPDATAKAECGDAIGSFVTKSE